MSKHYSSTKQFLYVLLLLLVLVGCGPSAENAPSTANELEPVAQSESQLNVVATTSIIGDVVAHIGGDAIELTVLIGRNQDAHSYEATPSDLVALEQADIIFVNGWDLEEQLAHTIEDDYSEKMVVISKGIDPLELGAEEDEEHHEDDKDHEEDEDHHEDDEDHEESDENHDEGEDHEESDEHHDEDDEHAHDSGFDPHVWFDIKNIEQWAANVLTTLESRDADNSAFYAGNFEMYSAELRTLTQSVNDLLADLPAEKRKLVTNHDAFGYFAAAYDFEIVGTVIPAASTNAEPSASDLVDLITTMQTEAVCTLFTETSQSDSLANTVAGELTNCSNVQVVALNTGALGDGATSTYIGMYQNNIEAIVTALR